MLKTLEYKLLCGLGALSIILVGVSVWLYVSNRSAQTEVTARAQYIQQSGPIRDLYQQVAKALAELAVKNHDEAVRAMLAQEGFTINLPATPEKSATPAPRGKQ